jgi:hypothetical protein
LIPDGNKRRNSASFLFSLSNKQTGLRARCERSALVQRGPFANLPGLIPDKTDKSSSQAVTLHIDHIGRIEVVPKRNIVIPAEHVASIQKDIDIK